MPGRNSWTCSRQDVTAPSRDVTASSRDVTAMSRDVSAMSRDVTTQNNVVQMSTGKKRGAEEADGMDTTEDEEAKKVKSDGDDGKVVGEKDSSPFQGMYHKLSFFMM